MPFMFIYSKTETRAR